MRTPARKLFAAMSRRDLGAILLAAVAGAAPPVLAAPADTLEDTLREVLPPGLDPRALGERLLAERQGTPHRAACLAHAGGPAAPRDLKARVAADFAAGRILAVDGWQLSATEAWLCAALACEA